MSNQSSSYLERVGRNIGILTVEQQMKLRATRVGVAGCGGIGGHASSELTYWGIGHLNIADLDVFDASNANRQLYASSSTIGKAKVDVVAANLRDIEPEIDLAIFPNGVTSQNAEDFVRNCDAIIDAIDYEHPQYSVALHRAARKASIPVYVSQCIGFGASVFAFYSDKESYDEFLGISQFGGAEQVTLEQIDLSKFCPIVPSYVDPLTFEKAIAGDIESPTVISGQTIAIGLTVSNLIKQILDPERSRLRMCAFDPIMGQYIEDRYQS